MGEYLLDLWRDKAVFRAALRGLGVTIGTSLLVIAARLAEWTGVPVEVWQAIGVALNGGSTAINAGQQNVRPA